ncbi:MAG TPA: hypothetical protein G4N92_04010 [Anaerolineae bacterium]|nr:hypothetical protein [Anaerolineae bacterium]
MAKNHFPSLQKVLLTSLILVILGIGGIAGLVFFTLPTIWPRWLIFFFLTLGATGLSLPFIYVLQRRISESGFTEGVLIREALLCAIYIDLLIWLQLGRVLNSLIALILAGGFLLFEFFLSISERVIFQPRKNLHE